MASNVHRTQILIDSWQYQLLNNLSKRSRKSISAIIRELINEKFSKSPQDIQKDSIFNVIGIGSGDGTPCAREHDQFIYQKRESK